jgi:uncharacterized protein (TIGR00730 family)
VNRRITVFCGSRRGHDPRAAQLTERFAHAVAARGIGVVYGGARNGLMGVLADAALAAGGEVIGVFPRNALPSEVAHHGLTQTHEVPDMHARKALMSSLGDAFVALPGGFGTFDELFEAMTWRMLGLHRKPLGVLELEAGGSPLRALVDATVAAGFADPQPHSVLRFEHDPEALIDALLP